MERAVAWLAGISTPVLFGATGLGVGLPLLATLWTPLPADVALVVVSVLAGASGAAGIALRQRLSSLPLELAPHVLTGRLNGQPVYRFRVRLGLGRPMRNARAEVTWRGEDGVDVPLRPLLAEAPALIGPWTLAVLDPDRRCAGRGAFTVRVRAEEGGRTWEVERRFPLEAARDGRFGPGLRTRGGRVEVDPTTFDTVVSEEVA